MRSTLLPFLVLTAYAQTDQTGSVSGVVTDAVTHMPVKKTIVSINPNGNTSRNQGSGAATTDATGAFTLGNLQAGHYRMVFQNQNYPQARSGGVTKLVEIKAGEAAGPFSIELIPGAAMSGHVVDEDGDPLPNCYVQIHPAKNLEQGVQMMGTSGSNQEGEWRGFGIAPGKYIVSAQCGHQVFQARPLSAGPDPIPSRAYPAQYYPLTSDAKSAQEVELTAGNEKSGVDFQMSPTAVTQIRGVFAPGGVDWHGGGPLMMQLIPLDRHARNTNNGTSPNMEKGTFEFRQIFPGSYMLIASSQGGEENRIGAVQRVDVGDKAIDLVLELKHAVDLSGKVEIESGGNTNVKFMPSQINIQLVPEYQLGVSYPQAQVGEDGAFTMKGVLPARWHLQLNAPFAFVKAAWLGSTEVTEGPIDLSGGAVGALRILVSTNMATIRGSAPAGEVVYAQRVEEDTPFRGNGSRGTSADQNGQYTFGGLPPGKYRLMLTDPNSAAPGEGGQEVTVREGETVTADLKAPSAP